MEMTKDELNQIFFLELLKLHKKHDKTLPQKDWQDAIDITNRNILILKETK